jgi:hypothetical protein
MRLLVLNFACILLFIAVIAWFALLAGYQYPQGLVQWLRWFRWQWSLFKCSMYQFRTNPRRWWYLRRFRK